MALRELKIFRDFAMFLMSRFPISLSFSKYIYINFFNRNIQIKIILKINRYSLRETHAYLY